jgi:small-conductance mechanosensitive channel
MPSSAFSSMLANDIGSALVEFGPIIIAIFLLVVFIMYLLAYITRYFHYLKSKDFVYLDDNTLEFVRKVLQALIVGLTIVAVIYLASLRSAEVRDVLQTLLKHMPSILFVVIVIIVAITVVRFLNRFAEYLRGNLKKKPKDVAPTGTLDYAVVVLKYSIYVMAGVVALIGGLALLPPEETFVIDWIRNISDTIDPAVILSLATSIVLLILITYIIARFLDTFYEDLKRRSTKYSIRINEILKEMSKNILYIVALLIGLFLVLSKFLSYTELLMTLGLVILLFVLVAFLASNMIRNSFSGLSLMISDPFSEGNRLRIGDKVCDVVEMNLTYTIVRTTNGELLSLPNSELMKSEIVNLTRSETFAMPVRVGIDNKVPPQRVEEMLQKAAEKTTGIINEPKAEIYGEEFKGDTIIYELLTYTNSPKEMKKVRSELIYNIQEVFKGDGLKISTPTD